MGARRSRRGGCSFLGCSLVARFGPAPFLFERYPAFVSQMQVIVASDIHGITPKLRAQLAVLGRSTILSPWPGDGCPYASEQDAVSNFHHQDGLSVYEQKIAQAVQGDAVLLVGFSVGATGLWRYIAGTQCNTNSRAILYYGSRIRDYVALTPRCSATVYFAEHEPSFPPEIAVTAVRKSGAFCSVVPGTSHGFMNPSSRHYRPDIAQEHLAMISSIRHGACGPGFDLEST